MRVNLYYLILMIFERDVLNMLFHPEMDMTSMRLYYFPTESKYGDSLQGLAGRQTWRLDGSSIRCWEERVPTLAGVGHHSIRCWECDMSLPPSAVGRTQTHPVG